MSSTMTSKREESYLSAAPNQDDSSHPSTDWPTDSVPKIPQYPEWKTVSNEGRKQHHGG